MYVCCLRVGEQVEDDDDRFPTFTGMVTDVIDVPLTLLGGAVNGRTNSVQVPLPLFDCCKLYESVSLSLSLSLSCRFKCEQLRMT